MNDFHDFRSDGRRKAPRMNATGIIDISPRNGPRSYTGKMFNFSERGMGFAADVPLNIMTEVVIEVAQSSELPQSKRFKGRVVWSSDIYDLDSGTYRYGIKFADPG